jgi:hypothetical protein
VPLKLDEATLLDTGPYKTRDLTRRGTSPTPSTPPQAGPRAMAAVDGADPCSLHERLNLTIYCSILQRGGLRATLLKPSSSSDEASNTKTGPEKASTEASTAEADARARARARSRAKARASTAETSTKEPGSASPRVPLKVDEAARVLDTAHSAAAAAAADAAAAMHTSPTPPLPPQAEGAAPAGDGALCAPATRAGGVPSARRWTWRRPGFSGRSCRTATHGTRTARRSPGVAADAWAMELLRCATSGPYSKVRTS